MSILILCLFVAAYVSAYVWGGWDELRTRRSSRRLLRLTSLLLVVAAFYFWRWEAQGTPLEAYAGWIFAGMLGCFVGDLITGGMAGFEKPFLPSMAAFSLGHVAYLVAVVEAGRSLEVSPDWRPWCSGAAVGVVGWAVAVRRIGQRTILNPLSLGYALLLGSVLGGSLWLASQRAELTLLAVGATLFSISDLLLGNREIRKARWFLMYDVIWAFYILGQLFIVWSVRSSLS